MCGCRLEHFRVNITDIGIAYFFDYGMHFIGDVPLAWRLPIACQVVFCFVSGPFVLFLLHMLTVIKGGHCFGLWVT